MPFKEQQNQWSCALACVVSLVDPNGNTFTQEDICKRYFRFFPEWREKEGVVSKMGILRLMEALNIVPNYVLMTDDQNAFLTAFTELGKIGKFVGGFILVQNPNHCYRVLRANGDVAEVFDPAPKAPQPVLYKWVEIMKRSPDFVLFGN